MKNPKIYILHYTQNKNYIKYYYLRVDHGKDKGLYEYVLFRDHNGYSDQRRPSFPVTQKDVIHAFNVLGNKADTSELIETDELLPEILSLYF